MPPFADTLAGALRLLPPETGHDLGLKLLAAGLGPSAPAPDPRLRLSVMGLDLASPLGLAAGFDKDGRAYNAALRMGFGFVEIGSVTPRPQPGNPKPRLFRLAEDRAVINRFGFNNAGIQAMAARLEREPPKGVLGINLGKNKDSQDAAADYVAGARVLGRFAAYVVVNVSSPNTPGLRALQDPAVLTTLLAKVRVALKESAAPAKPPPLLVKIAPDLEEDDLADIAALARKGAMDGLIVSNTTIARPDSLRGRDKGQAGGLSGEPLKSLALETLRRVRRLTQGEVPLIGVGGIASAEDAYARLRAGANLVQLYTAMVYEGPGLPARINRGLVDLLERDGLSNIAEAIGRDA